MQEFILADSHGHAPAVRAGDGGIALDIVRIVLGIGISPHAALPCHHLRLDGSQFPDIAITRVLLHLPNEVLLAQHFLCLQGGDGSTLLIQNISVGVLSDLDALYDGLQDIGIAVEVRHSNHAALGHHGR